MKTILQTSKHLVTSLVMLIAILGHHASAQTTPDLIKPPAGLNLGGTSFFDGFGLDKPGWVFINYGRFDFFDQINGNDGSANKAFTDPSLRSQSELFQLLYRSPLELGPGAFGWDVVGAFTNLDARFRPPGPVLRDNGLGLDDLTTGPFYQADPIIMNGRPVFSWRAEFDVLAPIGSFNRSADINQGSGFWSVNPYITATVLPTEKTEISARFNYLYNFQTTQIADPPSIPGLVYRNGQAGDLGWVNFAASYAITDKINLGINGFYLHQFDRDKLNGISIPHTQQEYLYLGPGAHIKIDEKNLINVNLYLPEYVRNGPSGPELNYQFVHLF